MSEDLKIFPLDLFCKGQQIHLATLSDTCFPVVFEFGNVWHPIFEIPHQKLDLAGWIVALSVFSDFQLFGVEKK